LTTAEAHGVQHQFSFGSVGMFLFDRNKYIYKELRNSLIMVFPKAAQPFSASIIIIITVS